MTRHTSPSTLADPHPTGAADGVADPTTTAAASSPGHNGQGPAPGPGAERPFAAVPRQLSRLAILAAWATAAAPMGLAMWVIGPAVAHRIHGPQALTRALIACLTVTLVWQFVLVVALVAREQGTLRWATVRDVLWLRPPTNRRDGRRGGRGWLLVLPLLLATAAEELIPTLPHPASRDLGAILQSTAGQQFLRGSWGWFAVLCAMFVFNTVLGEELFFRGFLLPRMNGAFGERDWVANGVLFAAYHVHVPWMMPTVLLDTFVLAYPTKRYRSALLGIAVHSAQAVVFTLAALAVVLK